MMQLLLQYWFLIKCRYYEIVANMPNIELILVDQPFLIGPSKNTLYYIESCYLLEILFNKKNHWNGAIYIIILVVHIFVVLQYYSKYARH